MYTVGCIYLPMISFCVCSLLLNKLPVVHITFWFNAHPIIKLFSLLSLWRGFLGWEVFFLFHQQQLVKRWFSQKEGIFHLGKQPLSNLDFIDKIGRRDYYTETNILYKRRCGRIAVGGRDTRICMNHSGKFLFNVYYSEL